MIKLLYREGIILKLEKVYGIYIVYCEIHSIDLWFSRNSKNIKFKKYGS